MPLISPVLIEQARGAIEKRAVGPDWSQAVGPAVGALGGAALGGLADRKHRLRGMLLGGGLGAGAGLLAGQFTPEIMAQIDRLRNSGGAPAPDASQELPANPFAPSAVPEPPPIHFPLAQPPTPPAPRQPNLVAPPPLPVQPPELPENVFATPGAKQAALIRRARAAIEKRAIIIPAIGAGIGYGQAPPGHRFKGAIRGAGTGLTTELGIPLGGLVGAGLGGLGGVAAGGLIGGGASLLGQAINRGQIDPRDLLAHTLGGATLGGGIGAIGGAVGGAVTGGREGFDIGKRYIWQRPWDREAPHGVSGADRHDDDDDKKKAASFGAVMGKLAAHYTGK
jgi:hypothetical protein